MTEHSSTVSKEQVRQIAQNLMHDPFAVLGPHEVLVDGKILWVARAWNPDAKAAFVREQANKKEYPMAAVHNPHSSNVITHDCWA